MTNEYDKTVKVFIAVIKGTKVTVTNGKIPVIDKNGELYGVNEVEWNGERWVSPTVDKEDKE